MKKEPSLVIRLRRALLRWYAQNQRDLPWRRTRDPYKIWVSEIMLQQTQVVTVIPYYERWIKAFPSLKSLAGSSLSRVLKFWAGLGYYRRARMFHQASRHVQKALHGKIPDTAEALRRLPGIGRYTAGAIASIAFGEKTPVLDGNVIRILSRIFAISQSVDHPATLERLWDLAASLLPDKDPGDLNQALMELGATVCFPFNPQCHACPAKRTCKAHHRGKELSYPARSQKEIYKNKTMTALVLVNPQNRVWLEKQPERGRWGGLWMFPFWAGQNEMLKELGETRLRRPWLIIRHGFTRYRITLKVFGASWKGNNAWRRSPGKWYPIPELARTAFPSPHKKIARALMRQTADFTPLSPA